MMDTVPDVSGRVVLFVEREVPPPRPAISLAADLRADLGLLWEDAEGLLERFFSSFSVDPGDIDIQRYFTDEGSLLINLAGRLMGRKKPAPVPHALTVGMLVRAAEAGVWRTAAVERH